MTESTTVAQRLARVRDRIADAVAKRGTGAAVTLIGVSKRQPVTSMVAAFDAGLRDFGENYAQDFVRKAEQFQPPGLTWHFIGALQTNKVKHVVGRALIQTVDRQRLVEAIRARVTGSGNPSMGAQAVLVEVNFGETQKAGVGPTGVRTLLETLSATGCMRCLGLMTIPPAGTPEQTRPYFRQLRELRDQLAEALTRTPLPNVELRHLSMGMSADYEVAIEEGATMVRVGTAIFGPRPDPP